MMKVYPLLGLGLLSVAVCSCDNRDPEGDLTAAKAAIATDQEVWNAELKARKSEHLAGHYAADAVLADGRSSASGSSEIQAYYADARGDPEFKMELGEGQIEAASDLAYARGTFTQRYTEAATGKVKSGSGTYVMIYRKQKDGRWKIVDQLSVIDPKTLKDVPAEVPATRAKLVAF